jgi:vancomycin permeability regulator SanA
MNMNCLKHLIVLCFLSNPPHLQADIDIVVLGGILSSESTMNQWTKARVDLAVSVYQNEAQVRQIILSGKGPRSRSEASVMGDYLYANGIPQHVVRLEEESMSTVQNAIFTYKKLKETSFPKKILLVTNQFHLDRALAWFNLIFANTNTVIEGVAADNRGFTEEYLIQTMEKERIVMSCLNKLVFPNIRPGDMEIASAFSTGKSELYKSFKVCYDAER